ncbi:MAG TPA: hypothetical protein VKX17_17400 [Planctomycetota bacterium]|nr:hypothetical protein [Planctomycetota bacterium]
MRIVLAFTAFAALANFRVSAACGDKITVAGGTITIPPVISWDANVDQAAQIARIKKKPFAIYFSCKDDCKIIGESPEALKAYMQANNNSVPATFVDVPKFVDQTREIGVGNFVKVPINKENKAIAEKYGAETNTMVVVAPSGEKITAFKCTSDVAKVMDSARKDLAAWHLRNQQAAVTK